MELIERYLQEVGRYLPADKRADILTELRSSLDDTLEARAGESVKEDEVIQILKELGAPRKVAASYYPAGQYLIGPELYPFFQFIFTIVLAASIGGQLIAAAVGYFTSSDPVSIVGQLGQIVDSLLPTVGSVVLIFAALQRFNVHPDFDKQEFDPRKLPPLQKDQPVSRGEKIFSIVIGIVFLAFFSQIAMNGGFSTQNGITVLTNPIIDQYFPWIALSMLANILLDVVLLWRGRWEIPTRIAKIGTNLFTIVVVFILLQGHTAWLSLMGVHGFTFIPEQFSQNIQGLQLLVMASFRIALFVVLIITGIETLSTVYQLFRAGRNHGISNLTGMALINK